MTLNVIPLYLTTTMLSTYSLSHLHFSFAIRGLCLLPVLSTPTSCRLFTPLSSMHLFLPCTIHAGNNASLSSPFQLLISLPNEQMTPHLSLIPEFLLFKVFLNIICGLLPPVLHLLLPQRLEIMFLKHSYHLRGP